jgi:hypothetical protein
MVIIYQNWLFPTLSNKNDFDQELEWTNTHETHHHECMVHEQEFFLLGSCSLVNFTIAKGSKNVQWVLKLGFIQVDGLKMRKWGWCVHACWVTLVDEEFGAIYDTTQHWCISKIS